MNITDKSLRTWNVIAGFAHLAQMIAILVLANDFTVFCPLRFLPFPSRESTVFHAIYKWTKPQSQLFPLG